MIQISQPGWNAMIFRQFATTWVMKTGSSHRELGAKRSFQRDTFLCHSRRTLSVDIPPVPVSAMLCQCTSIECAPEWMG